MLTFTFACSQKPARIVNNSKNFYNKKNHSTSSSFAEKKAKSRQIEVAAGDNIYSISKKNQVSVPELIRQNKLSAPYEIKKGDRLIIPPQNFHEVKNGETLYAISRLYGMKIDQLIEMNNLKEPYSIKAGEKVRISKPHDEALTPELPKEDKIKEEKPEAVVPTIVEKALDRISHFSWPVRGTVVSKFGPKKGGLYNDGINIKVREGEIVKASENGVVAYVGNELKGYGNLVIIKHSGGWITAYAHMKECSVKRGQKVEKHQKIGLVGATGNVTFPQLYFGLRKGRDAVNPENYLKS